MVAKFWQKLVNHNFMRILKITLAIHNLSFILIGYMLLLRTRWCYEKLQMFETHHDLFQEENKSALQLCLF